MEAWPYYLLCAVMGLTMWYQTKMMTAAQPAVDAQFAQTQKIMQFMPLILVFASFGFPIGLTLYWAATNVWTIGQQYFLLKKYGPTAAAPKQNGDKPVASQVKKAALDPTLPQNGVRKGPAKASSNGKAPERAKSGGQPKPKGSGSRKGKKKKGRR